MEAERARAHHHAYALLARLYRDGVTPTLLPYVREIAPLAAALPERFEPDEAAAVHQHVWGFNLYPFESYFLDPSGLLGGERAEAARAVYAREGFVPAATHEPDHLWIQLDFMARLSERGLNGEPGQRLFLHQHLARWLPPLVVAARLQGVRIYAELASLTAELVGEHLDDLDGMSEPAPLGATTDPLDDRRAGLRRIARHLATPYHAGLHLGRDALTATGRRLAIPTGFGSREQMLETLLSAAARYEQLPTLLDELEALVGRWERAYDELARTRPGFAPYVALWVERLGATGRILKRIRAESQHVVG